MHKRNLFLILILVLVILSPSFVSASENVTGEVKDDIVSSVSDENVIEENSFVENIEKDLNENSPSTDLIKESQNTNKTEKIDKVQVSRAENDEIQISSADNNQILRADTPHIDNYTFENGGTAQQVIERIRTLSEDYGNYGGVVLYLNGKTYTGRGELIAGDSQITEIKNVMVIGGTIDDPTKMATFTCADQYGSGGLAFNFRGMSSDWGTKFYSNSGYSLTNVSFYYINSEDKFLQFAGGGTLTDCVVDHCQSVKQFVTLVGCPDQYNQWGGLVAPKKALQLNNCNFTYCSQTYGFNPDPGYDDYYEGNGQFGEVLGAAFNNCNFINTTSGQHGGALCIADESEWGPGTVTSTVYNCNFINVTSRWFTIYIHGKFKTSPGDLDSPEQIINCTFVNCVGIGEFSGGIGISHSDIIIENCNFTDCSGGQGAAIMVGGIDEDHDGFNGDNYEANNVKIFNCTFTNNIASADNGYTYCTGWFPFTYDQFNPNKDPDRYYGWRDGNGGYEISGQGDNSDTSCDWEFKHEPKNYTASGNAGAIYVLGDGTYIKDCIFNGNKAESGKGAAIYIEGNNTKVENTKFYNHHSERGTIFIEGNNALILNSTFIDNFATSGAGVYVVGNATNISESTFEYNTAVEGAAAYIDGDKSEISTSEFDHNSVTNKGGAIYIHGSNSVISTNNFRYNEAIPGQQETTGLGGAIYVKGDNTNTDSNNFTYNMARNGSAIYTDGNNFKLQNDLFGENQAWSYLLIITPNPEKSYYNTTDINVTVRHVGGDNIINAIHNTASSDQIHFKNVTYENSNGDNITTYSTRFIEPVASAELSEGGTKLYQDSREYLQKVYLRVNHEDGEQIYETSRGDYLITDIYGEVNITLKRPTRSIHQLSQPLRVGEYNVYAEHPEDWNYRYINSTNTFRVIVNAYLAVDDVVLDYGESVNVTVIAEGAEGITAKIGGDDVAVNGYTIPISGLNAGTYNLTVTTVPDSDHNPINKTVTITVNKVNSKLTVYNVVLDYGETTNVNAITEGATGITAKINNDDAVVNGNTITIPSLDVGNYTLTVTTIADSNHNNITKTVTVTVNKFKTELTASALTTTYKINKDLVISLKDSTGKALSGVKVSVDLNGAKEYTTDSNGQVKVPTKGLVPKTYTVKIAFNGNTKYDKTIKEVKVTVKKATPKITAKKKTFKASTKTKKYTITLKDNTGKAIKKAKVTLKVKGKKYKAKTNSKGKATFKITQLNKKGTYKATVTYKVNKYYNKVTKKVKITVKKSKTK